MGEDIDFIAQAERIRAEHDATHGEAEMCGAECIVLGLTDDDEAAPGAGSSPDLRSALLRYGAHHQGVCRATILGPDPRCTCGLSAALAESGPSEPLDVERLARVFFGTTVLGTMFLPEARRLAERIAREYAALSSESPDPAVTEEP